MLVGIVAPRVIAEENHVWGKAEQKKHVELVKQLSADQIKAVSKIYPDFKVVAVCPGNFSGSGKEELVIGVWKFVESEDPWNRGIHRLGLIWNKNSWDVHNIDDELEKDDEISDAHPMLWQYEFNETGFVGDWRCGVESEFKGDSVLSMDGNKPKFDAKKMGLEKNKPVCFASSDTYNNWDCVVYSPRDGRFRLWFQQVYAD